MTPPTQGGEQEERLDRLLSALRCIRGPEDRGPWMIPYRLAGGGYEGLQEIAKEALMLDSAGCYAYPQQPDAGTQLMSNPVQTGRPASGYPQQTEGDERQWMIEHGTPNLPDVVTGPPAHYQRVVPKASLTAAEQRAEKAEAKFYLYRHGYDENVENLVAERNRETEHNELLEEANHAYEREVDRLQRENDHLKRLLKECKPHENHDNEDPTGFLTSRGSSGAPRFPKRSKREASDPADSNDASSPTSGDKQPEAKDHIWSDGSD